MFLVFDIGGSNIRISSSEDGENLSEPVILKTPQDFDEGLRSIATSSQAFTKNGNLKFAAGGIAGVLNSNKNELVKSPHLTDWSEKPIKNELEKIFGVPVSLENDTAMVGLGEANSGLGKGHKIIAYISIGTGVGGVRIVDGKIDTNVLGFEPGHQIIDINNPFKDDSSLIYLEDVVSGSAVEKRYGKKAEDIVDLKIWDDLSKYLAIGVNNTIVHWSPDVVILGGGMVNPFGLSVDRVSDHLTAFCRIFPTLPIVLKASLGDFGGLYGSLSYLKYSNS